MINWKIWYDDKTTFDSSQGDPEEAPPEGVICIVGYRKNGQRYITHGQEGHVQYYCYNKATDEWWGMDMPGLFDRLRRNLIYAFKEGRSVDDETFHKIMNIAHTDPDFPQVK